MKYNADHGITPQQIVKEIKQTLSAKTEDLTPDAREIKLSTYGSTPRTSGTMAADSGVFAADPIVRHMTREQLQKSIEETTRLMKQAAKQLDFIQAAQYRDEIVRLQNLLETKHA